MRRISINDKSLVSRDHVAFVECGGGRRGGGGGGDGGGGGGVNTGFFAVLSNVIFMMLGHQACTYYVSPCLNASHVK